jgi:hypothetical protein
MKNMISEFNWKRILSCSCVCCRLYCATCNRLIDLSVESKVKSGEREACQHSVFFILVLFLSILINSFSSLFIITTSLVNLIIKWLNPNWYVKLKPKLIREIETQIVQWITNNWIKVENNIKPQFDSNQATCKPKSATRDQYKIKDEP